MSKFCANCGSELNDEQEICLKCGVAVRKSIAPTSSNTAGDVPALVGFILGLSTILVTWIPFINFPVALCGIIFSAKGIKSNRRKGMAITGLVLSIISIIISIIWSAAALVGILEEVYYW